MPARKQTAVIIAFPTDPNRHRLRPQDKAEACAWEEAALRFGFDRIVIHEQIGTRGPEDGDFVLIYRAGDSWARWGAARQGPDVLLWRCANGVQAGLFPSMRAALETLLAPAAAELRPVLTARR